MATIPTALTASTWLGLLLIAIVKGSDYAKCELVSDLAMLLDSSASVEKEGFDLEKTFMKKLAGRFSILPDKTRISVVTFSHYIVIPVKFGDLYSEEQVKEAVDRLNFEGSSTATVTAIETMQSEVFSKNAGARVKQPGVQMTAVLFSDGFSGGGFEEVRDKMNSLKQNGIEVFIVAIGDKTNDKEIQVMASEPKQKHIFRLRESTNIDKVVNTVAREICEAGKGVNILV